MIRKQWHCAYMAAMLVLLAPAAGAAPQYFSVSPASQKYTRALALNDAGRYAVNSAGPETPYEGASINSAFTAESVGSLGGYITRIRSLNNAGEAVGVSTTGSGDYHAFLYSGGRMTDLTVRYGLREPTDINNRGEIVAQTRDSRAALLSGGAVHYVGPENSTGGALNDRGELLVGYFTDMGYRTALYRDGTLTDLPRVGGRPVIAGGMNDAGWIAGSFENADGGYHAFIWDGGTFTNLTPRARNAFAYDINNLGQVVGVADNRPFLYADGELIDLNTRIDPAADLLLISADEINDHTQILAHSCDRTGVFCYGSVLLTPVPGVPEPSSLAMLLAGLSLAAAHWLRRFTRHGGAPALAATTRR